MKTIRLTGLLLFWLGWNLVSAQTFTTAGVATSLGGNCWRLTSNTASVKGAVWCNTQINLNNPFDIKFNVMQDGAGWGADGVAFVLQNTGLAALGDIGSGLGYGSANGANPIINPSLAVEFDLWGNAPSVVSDSSFDHVAIHRNGQLWLPSIAGPVAALPGNANMDDNVCRVARVVWNPATTNIKVYFNNVLLINTNYDIINNVFGGNPMVYWGWTGSTGIATSEQKICYEFAQTIPDTNLCYGSSPITLTTTGGTVNQWYCLAPAPLVSSCVTLGLGPGFVCNTQSPTFNPPSYYSLYTYRVRLTNTYGCQDDDTVNINLFQNPTAANAGPDQNLCNLTTATLAGNAPAIGTGAWSVVPPGSAAVTTPSAANSGVTGLISGANRFVWTTSSGPCPVSRDTVAVNVFAPPSSAYAGPDQNLCAAASTNLAATPPATGTGTWTVLSGSGTFVNANSPTTSVSGFSPGNNYFIWTVSNGPCTPTKDTVLIYIDPGAVPANAGSDQNLCNVTTATLAGNSPGAGSGAWYVLSGGASLTNSTQQNSGVTGLSPGANYFEWVITSGICPPSRDTVIITVFSPPSTANAGANQNLCDTANTTLAATTPMTGTGTWITLSGTGSATLVNSPNSGFTGMTIPSTNQVVWEVANGPCTVSRDTISISVTARPSAPNAGPDSTYCTTQAVVLSGNAISNGTGTWSLVSGPNTPSITSPSGTSSGVTGLIAGSYLFQWMSAGGNCPNQYDTVSLTLVPAPVVDIPQASYEICNGQSVTLSPAVSNAQLFNWSPPNGLPGTLTQNVTATPTDTIQYFITVTDTNTGCTARDSAFVNVNPYPTYVIPVDSFFSCTQDTFSLVTNPSADVTSISWSPATGLSDPSIASPQAWPSSTTLYTVTFTTAAGCSVTGNVLVQVYDVQLAIGADTVLCKGDTLTLIAGAGASASTLIWSASSGIFIDDPSNDTIHVSSQVSGQIFVYAFDALSGCSDFDTINLGVQNLTLTADPMQSKINPGQSVNVTSDLSYTLPSAFHYSWTPPADLSCDTCASMVISPTPTSPGTEDSRTYTLTVTDTFGCSVDVQIEVKIDSFLVPNVFSPNGDGINDILFLNYYGGKIYKTNIFDRWGALVFTTADPNVNWNGKTSKGDDAPEGVYYLVLEIEDDPSIPDYKKNDVFNVTLMR